MILKHGDDDLCLPHHEDDDHNCTGDVDEEGGADADPTADDCGRSSDVEPDGDEMATMTWTTTMSIDSDHVVDEDVVMVRAAAAARVRRFFHVGLRVSRLQSPA